MIRILVAGLLLAGAAQAAWARATLLNISYDVTREFYKDSTPLSRLSGRPEPAKR